MCGARKSELRRERERGSHEAGEEERELKAIEWSGKEARTKEWALTRSGKRGGDTAVARKGECAGDRGQRNEERTLAEKKTTRRRENATVSRHQVIDGSLAFARENQAAESDKEATNVGPKRSCESQQIAPPATSYRCKIVS